MGGVVVWAVVKCQGYGALVLATVDALTIVSDIADQWPRDVERGRTQRFLLVVATVRISNLTVWTLTVVVASAAEASRRTTKNWLAFYFDWSDFSV